MFAKFVIAGFFTAGGEMNAIHSQHDELSLEVQNSNAHDFTRAGEKSRRQHSL